MTGFCCCFLIKLDRLQLDLAKVWRSSVGRGRIVDAYFHVIVFPKNFESYSGFFCCKMNVVYR